MKNQYFADFGDYQKFSLVKELQQDFSVIIHWMKTKDDHNSDGKHIAYLKKPEVFRKYDPEIFDFLKESILTRRDLDLYEQSKFAKGIRFENSFIEDFETRQNTFLNLITKEEKSKTQNKISEFGNGKSEVVLLTV